MCLENKQEILIYELAKRLYNAGVNSSAKTFYVVHEMDDVIGEAVETVTFEREQYIREEKSNVRFIPAYDDEYLSELLASAVPDEKTLIDLLEKKLKVRFSSGWDVLVHGERITFELIVEIILECVKK